MLRAYADGAVFGRRHGDGSPRVLALHGWQRDHSDWNDTLDGLDAIAVDLPGFGRSPEPDDAWSTARYAEALAPLLDEMEHPVVVVGHSFGGRVAVHLADQQPERVGAIVLTGVPGLWPSPDDGGRQGAKPALAYRVARTLHGWGVIGDERMERMRQKHGSADYRLATEVLRGVMVQAVNERYDDVLRRIRQPVELVWGVDDTAAPVARARDAAAALDHVTIDEVPGDHFTPTHAVAALRVAIDRRLDHLGDDAS